MLTTKRKPASVGEILVYEFMEPMGLSQGALAEAMGVQRKHVNELCSDRRNIAAANRTHPSPGIRQQPRLLAERSAAQRSLGSTPLTARTSAD